MKKRLILAMICMSLSLCGCGSSDSATKESSYDRQAADEAYYDGESGFSSGYNGDYAAEDYAAEDYAAEEAEAPVNEDNTSSGGITEEEIADYGSKIIRNASLSLDVKSLEAFTDDLKKTVKEYGGYVESMDVNSYDSEYSESRYGYYSVRIPAERLDDFLNIVKNEGTITAKSESTEDVTLQYVDTEARISSYEAERDSLMELLDKATSLKDILTIRDEIADVNYELDSLKRQLKSMQNRVSYSTVSINAKESRLVSISGGGEKSWFAKTWEHFIEELADGLDIAMELLIFLITRLPLFAILVLVVFVIVKTAKKIFGRPGREKKQKAGSRAGAKDSSQPQPIQGQPQSVQGQPGQPQPEDRPAGSPGESRAQQGQPPEEDLKSREPESQSTGHFTSNVPVDTGDKSGRDQ